MTNYGFTEHERNWWAERYRQGSAVFVIGWILFSFAVLGSAFLWTSVAVGSGFWLWSTAVLGIAGLAMVGIGTKMRKRPQTEFVETEHWPDKVA